MPHTDAAISVTADCLRIRQRWGLRFHNVLRMRDHARRTREAVQKGGRPLQHGGHACQVSHGARVGRIDLRCRPPQRPTGAHRLRATARIPDAQAQAVRASETPLRGLPTLLAISQSDSRSHLPQIAGQDAPNEHSLGTLLGMRLDQWHGQHGGPGSAAGPAQRNRPKVSVHMGVPTFVYNAPTDAPSAPATDMVLDINSLAAQAAEKCDYPTQNPLALPARTVKVSSNPADVVLDPSCGCATTLLVAVKLDRMWVGIDLGPTAVTLVRRRMERELGGLVCDVVHRTDVPAWIDLGKLPNYQTHRHVLYGKQEGNCELCGVHFPYRSMTVDDVVSRAKGGTDHVGNLQMLCGACNSLKGTETMSEARVRFAGWT